MTAAKASKAAQGTTTTAKGDMPTTKASTAAAKGEQAADQNKPNGNAPAADDKTDKVKEEDAAANGTEPAENSEEAKAKAELQKKEDEALAKGQAIAKTRHLMARAFTKPAEEPAQPMRQWDYMLAEVKWLAVDFNQERLWKRTTALAVAYEVAKLQGNFGLKPPPKDSRKYHDEIKKLRVEAAKELAPQPEKTGRRAAAAAAKAERDAALAAANSLKLDPEDDPIFSDLDASALPGTPDVSEIALVYRCDEEFVDKLHEHLMQSDVDRILREEIAYRSYNFEYEASLVSHLLAIQEQQRQANTIADLGGFGYGTGEDDEYGSGKKKARRKAGRTGGYLLDDFSLADDEFTAVGTKRTASKANLDNIYLQKQRVRRYRDVDVDYDAAAEGRTGYGTRQRTGALRAGGGRTMDRNRRAPAARDAYQYQSQVAQRQRLGPGAAPGMPLWSRPESDLLLAVVHEFGLNWTIVSEVLSQSLSMQGIYRTPAACKSRFRQITQQEAGQDYTEDRAYANLSNLITKQRARELIAGSLPVREDVLRTLLETLVQIGAAAKDRKIMEDRRNEALRTKRQDMHSSYITVLNNVMGSTGGRHYSPIELSALVNNAYQHQAQQQKMLAQQAQMQQQQAVAQMAAQQQQLPAAAAGQQPAANGAAAQGGAPPAVAGAPAAAATNGAQPAAAAGQSGAAGGATGKTPINLATINQILTTGKLPNGLDVTPDMRQALEQRRDTMVQQLNAAMAVQRTNSTGATAAAAAGSPAALAAMQQAAAAGARPAMPANMALPAGMAAAYAMPGMQAPMQAQQLAAAQMAAAQAGGVLPPGVQQQQQQQQQLLAQQMAAQQQAAAAAAAKQGGK